MDVTARRQYRVFPESVYDACSQAPRVEMALDDVSIFRQRIYLECHDRSLGEVSGLFKVRAGVSLKAEQRGIHMSRIESAFRDVPRGLTLPAAALHLARSIRESQAQATARVSLRGTIPFDRQTQVTSQRSPGTLRLRAQAIAGDSERVGLGVKIGIMTCCPCMQAYSLEETARFAGLDVPDPATVLGTIPVATHSQKGHVTAIVDGSPNRVHNISLGCISEAVTGAVHPTWELLKRPDEFELVRRAHLRAQFVEDVVREVVAALVQALSGLTPSDGDTAHISVRAESLESIHGHDISASKRVPLS
jgi:GTP cyclohydrolase-4